MSIETPETADPDVERWIRVETPLADHDFEDLSRLVARHRVKSPSPADVFGDAVKRGAVYRWGLAIAQSGVCDRDIESLTRLACGRSVTNADRVELDLESSAQSFVEWAASLDGITAYEATSAVIWGAALPALLSELPAETWWRLLETLVELNQQESQRYDADSPIQLILGAELGLTLSWCVGRLLKRGIVTRKATKALANWCDEELDSVSVALQHPTEARLVLASLLRCRRLLKKTTSAGFRASAQRTGDTLATWVAALTTPRGGSAFSDAMPKEARDDLGPNGLLASACEFDPDCLRPAFDAARGATPTGGRLAWEVTLPEAIHHDPHAKIAVMFADWDVRRARTYLRYAHDDLQLEIYGGRSKLFAGTCQTLIATDGAEQQPAGGWDDVCEYSDDDVHYLELEQRWSGGLLLQRQIMLVRDDRCLLFADSVLPDRTSKNRRQVEVEYALRLPLADGVEVVEDNETREVFLVRRGRRALAMPLLANEWKVGPSDAAFKLTDDGCLLMTSRSRGALYAPLWLDFQRRRFSRKRTWRALTIADELRIVDPHEAVGYRVQVGSEHWVIYRSLEGRRPRTFLGKHMIADFFSSRFDPGDGGHEELVTVDDNEQTTA